MGWWPFGRKEDGGRHALGAAVTSLPSGPLVLPLAVPAVTLPPVAPEPVPALGPEVLEPTPVERSLSDLGAVAAAVALVDVVPVEAVVAEPVAPSVQDGHAGEVPVAPEPVDEPTPVDVVAVLAAEPAPVELVPVLTVEPVPVEVVPVLAVEPVPVEAVPVVVVEPEPLAPTPVLADEHLTGQPEPLSLEAWSVEAEPVVLAPVEPVDVVGLAPVEPFPVLVPQPELLLEPRPAPSARGPVVDGPVADLGPDVLDVVEQAPALVEPALLPVVQELTQLLAAADPAALDLDALLGLLQAPLPVAAPVDLQLPVQRPAEPAAPVHLPVQGRVQLGFRDGSTASLEPDSDSAVALGELARLLTGTD